MKNLITVEEKTFNIFNFYETKALSKGNFENLIKFLFDNRHKYLYLLNKADEHTDYRDTFIEYKHSKIKPIDIFLEQFGDGINSKSIGYKLLVVPKEEVKNVKYIEKEEYNHGDGKGKILVEYKLDIENSKLKRIPVKIDEEHDKSSIASSDVEYERVIYDPEKSKYYYRYEKYNKYDEEGEDDKEFEYKGEEAKHYIESKIIPEYAEERITSINKNTISKIIYLYKITFGGNDNV